MPPRTVAERSRIAKIRTERKRQDEAMDAAITTSRNFVNKGQFDAAALRLGRVMKEAPRATRIGDATALLEEARRGLPARQKPDGLLPGVRKDVEWVLTRRSESQPVKSLLLSFDSSARENWRKAAGEGCPEAQLLMGWCYDLVVGVARDGDMAADYYRKAAEQGNAWAQFNLSRLYGGDLRRTSLTVEAREAWLRKAAERGLGAAQESLGLCYYDGKQAIVGSGEVTCTIEKNRAEAARWFRKAAEQGSPAAQCCLGYMCIDGDGVKKDLAEAVTWFRKAAEQGISAAQNNLGVAYAAGAGVQREADEALRWITKASENEGGRNVADSAIWAINSNLSLLRNGVTDASKLGLVLPDIPESVRRREVWSFRGRQPQE